MRRIAIVLLIFGLVACKNDTTRPRIETFALEVNVTNVDRSPVEGLHVAVWNLSSSLRPFLQDDFPKRRAATEIRFQLPREAVCSLTIYDLEGRELSVVLDRALRPAGQHSIVVGPTIDFGAGVVVMKYEMAAVDPDTGSELFRDEKFMTAVHLDPTRLVTGTTDASGSYRTEDRTVVPGLYELPELQATDETGTETGGFVLDQSLVVRVYDDQGAYLQSEIEVVDGVNRVSFTWDPAVLSRAPAGLAGLDRMEKHTEGANSEGALPPIEFRLYQNYPNPFN